MRKSIVATVVIVSSSLLGAICRADWPKIPPMDWSHVQPTDFKDNELDIPYLLEHFHTVANAVVENGPNRGFLDIKVNREPKDNQPYNARIQETNRALSYFYCMKRPWNPYYGSPAVKVRLQAMLEFWCSIQGPQGQFSEYKPQGWGIAPTGFGIEAMAQTLTLLKNGGPTIDPGVLDRTMAAQRKAILWMLTSDESFRIAADYSNQFSGVYFAALSYLRMKDDSEMRTALEKGTARAISVTQSPTGLLYEAGGLDFGYSGVHLMNIRIAWPLMGDNPTLRAAVLDEDQRWNHWLGYNLVLQPDHKGYFVNAGVNCRTSFAYCGYTSKPLSQEVENSRCFAMTPQEWQAGISRKREQLAADWPHFKPLVVPSSKSYDTGPMCTAVMDRDTYFPTAEQRDAAIAGLPYLAKDDWSTLAFDPRGYYFTYARRPSFYAIFNSGKVRVAGHQNLGLGLLWNPKLGCVLQEVGGTDIAWGTRLPGEEHVCETHTINAIEEVNGLPVNGAPGYQDLPAGPIAITYDLPGGGSKRISIADDSITVTIQHPGDFIEQLPLVKFHEDALAARPGILELTHDSRAFHITFDPAIKAVCKDATPVGEDHRYDRVMLELAASDELEYRLNFNSIGKGRP